MIRELVRQAVQLERQARWSEASSLWAQLRRNALESGPIARLSEIPSGTLLSHRKGNNVLATCLYTGQEYIYAGKGYQSLSAAANAAARDLGYSAKRRPSGRIFWRI